MAYCPHPRTEGNSDRRWKALLTSLPGSDPSWESNPSHIGERLTIMLIVFIKANSTASSQPGKGLAALDRTVNRSMDTSLYYLLVYNAVWLVLNTEECNSVHDQFMNAVIKRSSHSFWPAWSSLGTLAETWKQDWLNTNEPPNFISGITFLNTIELTKHKINSAECVTYSTNFQQWLTLESWYTKTSKPMSTATCTLQTTHTWPQTKPAYFSKH